MPGETVIDLTDAPPSILRLRRDVRGYPVPWFVKWFGDRPDFRMIDAPKFSRALAGQRCWLCGERLGRYLAFVIGPMCTVNRISSEPPSHRDCGVFAARVCPFLTRPRMHRQDHNMPEHEDMPGIPLLHNPGACAVWVTRSFSVVPVPRGRLIELGEPVEVMWFREGRPATRDEASAALAKGLRFLRDRATTADEQRELADRVCQAERWLPAREAATEPAA